MREDVCAAERGEDENVANLGGLETRRVDEGCGVKKRVRPGELDVYSLSRPF